jgi:hypothetical protein
MSRRVLPWPARHRASLRLGVVGLFVASGLVLVQQAGGDARCVSSSPDEEPDTGVRLTGRQSERFQPEDLERGSVVDARGARWRGREPYVIVIEGTGSVCVSGGTARGTWPASTSWDEMHGTGALVLGARRAVVEDVRVDGYGDSLRFVAGAQDFVVRRVHLSDSRDDCIENDWLYSGTVRNSLLDGCFNAFSARTYGQAGLQDGSEGLWSIENSLVRLQPMQRPYADEGRIPGTAGFFKWDPRGPRLSLHGNVFRADQPANTVGLGLPAGKLADCSDNVMVWLGRGEYPAELPSCFSLTNDPQVWDEAVARWKRRYGRGRARS